MRKLFWTKNKLEILKQNANLSNVKLAELFNTSISMIKKMKNREGIKKIKKQN